MTTHNQEKIVFITGSSSGIGRATALRFAKAGYAVVVTYFHNEEAGKSVIQECLNLGAADVLLIQLDVTDRESIEKDIEQIVQKFRRIDTLINNAGVAVKGLLVEQSEEDIQNQIATNLAGSIMVTRVCLPRITRSIIFVGSKTALKGKKGMSVYSATKFGLRGFAQSLALEYPNLYVSVVNPGSVATRLGGADGESPDVVAEIIYRLATRHYGIRSGWYVNVWEYRYGRLIRYGILFIAFVKRIVKKMLRRSL